MPPGDGEKDPDVRYTDVTKESGKLATNQAHDYQSSSANFFIDLTSK